MTANTFAANETILDINLAYLSRVYREYRVSRTRIVYTSDRGRTWRVCDGPSGADLRFDAEGRASLVDNHDAATAYPTMEAAVAAALEYYELHVSAR